MFQSGATSFKARIGAGFLPSWFYPPGFTNTVTCVG